MEYLLMMLEDEGERDMTSMIKEDYQVSKIDAKKITSQLSDIRTLKKQ